MKTSILALAAVAGAAVAGDQFLINEFQPNPDGSDPSMVDFEIRGAAGTMFTGAVYSVEGDFAAPNFVDRVNMVSGMFNSDGILNVQIGDLENPSFTVVLASGGSATTSDSIDGSSDITALFGTVYDAITINDNDTDNAFSIVPLLGVGTNLPFTGAEPELVFRDALDASLIISINDVVDGTEAVDQFGTVYDLATDFFDVDGNAVDLTGIAPETFGSVNYTTIPAPGAVALAGLGGLVAVRRRRA